jgi:hypothetical protein
VGAGLLVRGDHRRLRPRPGVRLALLGWARRKTNVENMRTTLERIKAAAEAG